MRVKSRVYGMLILYKMDLIGQIIGIDGTIMIAIVMSGILICFKIDLIDTYA